VIRHPNTRQSRSITRRTFLGSLGIIGVTGAALCVIGSTGVRPFSRLSGEATIPSTYTANPSDFTQKIGLPGAPSRIPGSVSVPPDDPSVRFRGGATTRAADYPNDVRGTGITPRYISPCFEIEFLYDGRKLEVVEYTLGESFTPIFDDVIGPTDTNTPNDATLHYRLLDFGKENVGRVRLQLNHYNGLYIEDGSTIKPVPTPKGPRAIFLGDSYTEGSEGSCSGGYVIYAGIAAGLDAWPSEVGGTGIVSNASGLDGKVKFRDRVSTDVIPFNPDVVVIAGGINDRALAANSQTLLEYRAEYDLLLEEIKTGLPAAKIVVLGPFSPQTPSSYDPGLTTIRDDNQAAAQAAGVPFIDVFYFTDANKSKYISDDTVHSNAAGHEYLGKKLGADLVQARGLCQLLMIVATDVPRRPHRQGTVLQR
jgi:lysophospholipase L1-like esterase